MSLKKSKHDSNISYRGRFAPSATGPLHLGSIYAALVSYLDAKNHHGEWLIRIDDLDSSRCKARFSYEILKCLELFRLQPSESIVFQSDRITSYKTGFNQLYELGRLYTCTCTRKILKRKDYRGNCRKRLGQPLASQTAIRIDTNGMSLNFRDRLQGNTSESLCGDFVVRRRDGLFAYQLACAIDESIDRITHVIRGLDLMPSTPMQTWIMNNLNLNPPCYGHHPILIDRSGFKLSKQTFAAPVDPLKPGQTYFRIAQLFKMTKTPAENAPAEAWLEFFQNEVSINTLLPKVTNIVV